jgi:hypothetical protein
VSAGDPGELIMRIENSPTITLSKQPTSTKVPSNDPKDEKPVSPAPATFVAISGQTLLRQRLFCGPADVEPPMLDVERTPVVLQPLFCLNKEDRLLLGEIYEFAQSEVIDLAYVDRLGHALANYRGYDDGRRLHPHNQGKEYDLEGHRVSYSFTDKDAITAERIKASSSLLITRLDRGFIDFDTDKNRSSLRHSDFEFLELIVNRFSGADESIPVNGRFQKHEHVKNDFVKHVSKEVYGDYVFSNLQKPEQLPSMKSPQSLSLDSPQDISSTLRQIIQKYLEKSGIPTLFDMIARLRR